MGEMAYLESFLVFFSFLLTVGYHGYLWHSFNHKPSTTSIGVDALIRKKWLSDMKEGDVKKGNLVVQSLRNKLMSTILTASIAIMINISLGALTNNAYKASNLFKTLEVFGSQSPNFFALKYGSASTMLLISFLCCSIAIRFLIDANYMMNACEDENEFICKSGYSRLILERGFMMGIVGNRVLCIGFTLLLWMFGPYPVVLSSLGLVWGLYGLDFQVTKL